MARRSNGEGTAPKQKKNGTWYRAIRMEGTGKRKYLYAETKAELDKKYKEFSKQLAAGTYVEINKQSVEEYMMDWLTVHKKSNGNQNHITRWNAPSNIRLSPISKARSFSILPMTIYKNLSI